MDYKRELQLGGDNAIGNLWLLDSTANRSSGSRIRGERDRVIQGAIDAADAAGLWPEGAPSLDTVRWTYTVEVESVVPGLEVAGEPSARWTLEQVRDQGAPLAGLEALDREQVDAAGLRGSTRELYSERWQLAAVEIGSGLALGARFPIRYREGEPFDISLDDVTFVVPDIDTTALLRRLVSRIT